MKQLWVIPERREFFTSRSAEDGKLLFKGVCFVFFGFFVQLFDHFIGVFYYLVGRSMLSCYHGVHGQLRRAFAFFFVVVDFFLNNNNLQFLTSKIERVLGKKKQIAPDHFNGLYFLPIA